jgi:phosphocarrier protein HPr
MLSRSVTVSNRLGLHARAAAKFVHLASRFQSHVKVSRGSQTMDGKSIMGILLLAAAAGTVLTVSANGDDEQAAVDVLCAFIETGFGEDTCSA